MFAGERGKYYLSPVIEGPAERAGVQAGDHLLSINGVMVSKLTHSSLMKMVGWYGIHQGFYLLLVGFINFFLLFFAFTFLGFFCLQFKKCGEYVTILVIDCRSEESYTRRRLPILPVFASTHNLPHRPKTLYLTQGPQGYGFLLRQEKLTTGHIGETFRIHKHSFISITNNCDIVLLFNFVNYYIYIIIYINEHLIRNTTNTG